MILPLLHTNFTIMLTHTFSLHKIIEEAVFFISGWGRRDRTPPWSGSISLSHRPPGRSAMDLPNNYYMPDGRQIAKSLRSLILGERG